LLSCSMQLDWFTCLARSANWPKGLYILPMFFLYFFIFVMKWSPFKPGSTESNGLMFTKISGLVDGHNCLFTSLSFFNFSTTLPWQPIKVKKIGVFPGPIYFVALPFRNRLQYRNSNFKRLNTMNFSTLFFDILW